MAKDLNVKSDYSMQLSQIVKYMLIEDWDFEVGTLGVHFEIFDGRLFLNKDGTWRYEK